MATRNEREKCRIDGCSKLVLNRSGKCMDHRQSECKQCKAEFTLKIKRKNPAYCRECSDKMSRYGLNKPTYMPDFI